MLSPQSLNSQYPLAANLDALNICVQPVTNSILYELTQYSCTDDAVFTTQQPPFEFNPELILMETSRADRVTGQINHDIAMDKVVDAVFQAVSGYLSHARTVVVPMIDEFVKGIEEPLKRAARESTLNLNIQIHELPAPYREAALFDETARAKDIPLEQGVLGVGIPLQNTEQAQKLVLSSVTSLDKAVDAMLADLPENTLQAVVNTVFGEGSGQSFHEYIRKNPAYPVIAYLVARKHWDKPIEGTPLPLRLYEQRMLFVRDQAAKAINDLLYIDGRDQKAGILIKSYTRDTVVVNKAVYDQWLAAGGINEVLFGAIVDGTPAIRAEEIAEKAATYLSAWERHMLVNASVEANNRFAACKGIARAEMIDTLAAAPADIVPLAERQRIMAAFEEELAKTTEEELKDVACWVMRLVTKSVFAQTDAYEILLGMHRVRNLNDEYDAQQASHVAAAEYVAHWLAHQFNVIGLSRPV